MTDQCYLPNVANVPDLVAETGTGSDVRKTSKSACSENRGDVKVWDPNNQLTESEIKKYIDQAHACGVTVEKAHNLLSYFDYNTELALIFCENFDIMEGFSKRGTRILHCTARPICLSHVARVNESLKEKPELQPSTSKSVYYLKNATTKEYKKKGGLITRAFYIYWLERSSLAYCSSDFMVCFHVGVVIIRWASSSL
ncbi:hypothetical protein DICVIV_13558 [Dictyocaulus viviparus]|uniref:ELM2 domain-containing protein n=1 Tax=Dictyocaulus viviparus TaxID=29172 RepID=A0A0D8X9N3_DICVI|nr:hypothetical protein DICVIV_13558 [Dictyocaulus viviparus]